MTRKSLLILILGFLVVFLYPVSYGFSKTLLLAFAAGIWLNLCWMFRQRRTWRAILLGLPIALVLPLLLPARTIDRPALRTGYLSRLIAFTGTKYVWGGENHLGIDCSGLPRRAWRGALFSYGLRHADGGTLRAALEQWWYDTSASALGTGYRGFTVPLPTEGKINIMDHARLEPGDLAVNATGIHVLVYLGEDRWIQADPGIGHVAALHARHDENPWFRLRMTTHRWNLLTPP